MRPDCSLRIRPAKGSTAPFEEVWLHFDAKYRIDALQEIFGKATQTRDEEEAYLEEEQQAEETGTAKREDLLKMHAYRDAIRRSAGAYVVYPGTENSPLFAMFHEILPGLGAFALRPVHEGDAEGLSTIERFLGDVLDHVASQAMEYERERYWVRQAHDDRHRIDAPVTAVPFLTHPPADTPVLLGYVKNQKHLEWIHQRHLYNMRADGCVFRTDSTTHFGRIRPRISGQIDHSLRLKSTSHFG